MRASVVAMSEGRVPVTVGSREGSKGRLEDQGLATPALGRPPQDQTAAPSHAARVASIRSDGSGTYPTAATASLRPVSETYRST